MRSLIAGAADRLLNRGSAGNTHEAATSTALQDHYDGLELRYLNGDIYGRLAAAAHSGTEAHKGLAVLRSLRNPVTGVVEFYARRLVLDEWLEDLEAVEALKTALGSVWDASNYPSEGRPLVRQFATLGDVFWKVGVRYDADDEPTDVIFETVDPRCVTDFEKDGRGFFRYLRIDVPKTRRDADGEPEAYTLTEVWDKETGLHRRWEHDKGTTAKLSQLGKAETTLMSVERLPNEDTDYAGYDFVPVVHRKCRDVGFDRGLCAFAHALPDVAEADRLATKLHEILFPDVVWVAASNAAGPDGEFLPPMELRDDTLGGGQGWARGYEGHRPEDQGFTSVGNDKLARLPGGYTLEPKIPDRNLQPLIEALDRQVAWAEQKLPEAVYGPKLRELELSGAAMEISLLDVTDAYKEVGGNLADGMAQAGKMALSIGQAFGLSGFSVEEIGTYEAGDFDHKYELPPPFPKPEGGEAGRSAFDRVNGRPEEDEDAVGAARRALEGMSGGPDPTE